MFEGGKRTRGVVYSDGGMRTVESAAVDAALHERGFNPEIRVGVSGGAANTAYAAAGQGYLALRIWLGALTKPDFVSMRRLVTGNVIDIDYMIDEVFAKRLPLDREALRATNTKFFLGTTHTASRRPKYFTNEDIQRGVNPLEVLRAATSIPGMTGAPVDIQGDKFEDGIASIGFKDSIQVALDAGAEFVVAVDSRNDTLRAEFREEFARSGWSDKVVLLQPESKATMVSGDAETLEQSFNAGWKAVASHPVLNELFGDVFAPRRAAAA